MSIVSEVLQLGFFFVAIWRLLSCGGLCDSVTLIPPENSLNMFAFDVGNGAIRRQPDPLQPIPLARFPKHAGVLSGVPIPTLWPVLPILSTTTRRPKSLADFASKTKQLSVQNRTAGDSLAGQIQALAQTQPNQFPLQPAGSSVYGAAATSQAQTGGLGYLSQIVQPSQPVIPSSPFVGNPMQQPVFPGFPQQLQVQTNAMQYQVPENPASLTFPQNNLAQQSQQQQPIGQSFASVPNAQLNPQLTAQDILLSTGYQQNAVAINPQQVNAFGHFMPPEVTAGQYNSPAQMYGYGQAAVISQLQQQLAGQQILSQAGQNGGLLQQNPQLLVPGSAYASSLEEQYPGCHRR